MNNAVVHALLSMGGDPVYPSIPPASTGSTKRMRVTELAARAGHSPGVKGMLVVLHDLVMAMIYDSDYKEEL